MIDPEPYIQRMLEDEGLTSDLDETDALTLLTRLAEIVRAGPPARTVANFDDWVASIAQRGRKVAKVVAEFRDHGSDAAQKLAKTHGLNWPTNTDNLVAHLLRGAGHG